jgi:hypothetical protein
MGSSHSQSTTTDSKEFHIQAGSFWDSAWKYAAIVGAVGVVGSAVGAMSDVKRFAFSWLFAFFVFLTVALGGMFFVVIQHLTSASWSVSLRRLAEFLSVGVVALVFLFFPLIAVKDELYGEWMHHNALGGAHSENLVAPNVARAQGEHGAPPAGHGAEHGAQPGADHGAAEHGGGHGEHNSPEHALHGELLTHKSGYLNTASWGVRAFCYLAIWVLIALFYFRTSTEQDKSRDMQATVRMQRWAPLATMGFAFTLTFAAFDWVMALLPNWYSTIYGVCVFAGSAVAIHAILIVLSLALKGQGLLGDAVNTEHLHDLGKLMFGFNVFWAYVSFSQMMLIWYAGIPEEAVYYHMRWGDHGWTTVSAFLLVGHFVFPFFFLLSRNIKRRATLLGFGAAWMLFMHVIDLYWYVLPHFEPGAFSGSPFDLTALLAVGGIYFAVVFYLMRQHALVPIGDPRLSRALGHQNA